MESVPRNVILDLLPAYIAGEASRESCALVEEFAQTDPQIARLIRAGKMDSAGPLHVAAPDDLEMKAIKRIRSSIRRQMLYVALATAAILMIPLVAMQFTSEVDWTLSDFIIMGILLFGAGGTYVLIARASENGKYRIAVGIAVGAVLLLIWMNLAVGIIGSEDNPANLLYLAVPAVGLIGAVAANFRPRGMARAMFAMAITHALVPVTALIIWRPSLDDAPGIVGVFVLNLFYVMLFLVSGFLFRNAANAADRR